MLTRQQKSFRNLMCYALDVRELNIKKGRNNWYGESEDAAYYLEQLGGLAEVW